MIKTVCFCRLLLCACDRTPAPPQSMNQDFTGSLYYQIQGFETSEDKVKTV
ncbi:MAG: hypothetical protein V7K30_31980 [Nostoc sp.]